MNITNKIKNKSNIPLPALSRLCKMFSLFNDLQKKGEIYISSNEIGNYLSVGSHNIRKDIGYLGEPGTSGTGYEISRIRSRIEETLGLAQDRKACIIGLGTLGSLLINYNRIPFPCFTIIAGFDSNINTLETIQTDIPVYPTYEIPSVIKNNDIELAIIAEADNNIQTIIDRLVSGGIKGILNFTPALISSPAEGLYIKNIDIFTEFRYISAVFTMNSMRQ